MVIPGDSYSDLECPRGESSDDNDKHVELKYQARRRVGGIKGNQECQRRVTETRWMGDKAGRMVQQTVELMTWNML